MHSGSAAAEKENPRRGLTQNPRGQGQSTPTHAFGLGLGLSESGTVSSDCKLPKGSSEPTLKDTRQAAQNKRQANPPQDSIKAKDLVETKESST